MGLCPGQCLLEFLLIVDVFRHPANQLHFVHRFHAHAQIFLKERGIDNGTCDAHADRADLQVGLPPHGGRRHRCPAEPQKLFLHILRNFPVVRILYVPAVNAESRQSLLRMGSQNRGQIHRAGTLRTVKSPDAFDGHGIHVHGLRPVAPARGHRQRDVHPFPPELGGAFSCLSHPADGTIGDHHANRFPIGIAEIFPEQLCRRLRHASGLLLHGFPHLQGAPAGVDSGTDADDGIFSPISVFCHISHPFRTAPLGGGLLFSCEASPHESVSIDIFIISLSFFPSLCYHGKKQDNIHF